MDVNENDVQEAETSGCLKPEDVYCDLDADEFQTIQNRFSLETQDMTGHSDEELSDSPFELDVQINRLSLSDDRKNFPAANRCLLARRRGSTGQITAMKLKKISSPISEVGWGLLSWKRIPSIFFLIAFYWSLSKAKSGVACVGRGVECVCVCGGGGGGGGGRGGGVVEVQLSNFEYRKDSGNKNTHQPFA